MRLLEVRSAETLWRTVRCGVQAREAVLRYSREIAFAAAGVYARAAEQRGAWDARLEALVVDAIVRGDVSDSLRSRASALGWSDPAQVTVMAGGAPSDDTERVLAHTRRLGHDSGAEVLTGVQSGRLVVIAGAGARINRITKALLPAFAEGPVVVGPTVTGLLDAATSVQDVFAALRAVCARPTGSRPVAANDLLPERALAGDARATRMLISSVYAPLHADPTLLETADALVDSGGPSPRPALSITLWGMACGDSQPGGIWSTCSGGQSRPFRWAARSK